MDSRKGGSVQKQLTAPGSVVHRYRQTVVGKQGWGKLLLYEFVELFIQPFAGQIGKYGRRVFMPFLLANFGSKVNIGINVAMRRPGCISIGSHVKLSDSVTLNIKDDGLAIILEDNVIVGEQTIFSCIGGELSIGEETVIGDRCRLGSKMGLTVGRNCAIGRKTYIVGASHAYNRLDKPIIDQNITCKGPSFIGDSVTIGQGVTLLDGVRIGDHAVICDGSLVNHDVEPGWMVGGVPACRLEKPAEGESCV